MHIANRNKVLFAIVIASGFANLPNKNQRNEFLKLIIVEQRVNDSKDKVALCLDWHIERYDNCDTPNPNIVVYIYIVYLLAACTYIAVLKALIIKALV